MGDAQAVEPYLHADLICALRVMLSTKASTTKAMLSNSTVTIRSAFEEQTRGELAIEISMAILREGRQSRFKLRLSCRLIASLPYSPDHHPFFGFGKVR
jgi:hypothetical protein